MKATTSNPKPPAASFRSLAREQMPPLETPELPSLEAARSSMSVGAPSKPILGLPLARIVPMDLHSMMDYGNGLMAGAGAFSDDNGAKLASITLASLVIGISAVTDYKLSVAKLVPIEVHEVADYVWGASAIAAPFLFGYWKSSPKTALTHIVCGVGTIISSLITDYRAYSKRSQTSAR